MPKRVAFAARLLEYGGQVFKTWLPHCWKSRRLIGGMGALAGKTPRIGDGGPQGARSNYVSTLFGVEEILRRKGMEVPRGSKLIGIEGLPL